MDHQFLIQVLIYLRKYHPLSKGKGLKLMMKSYHLVFIYSCYSVSGQRLRLEHYPPIYLLKAYALDLIWLSIDLALHLLFFFNHYTSSNQKWLENRYEAFKVYYRDKYVNECFNTYSLPDFKLFITNR